MSYSLIYSDPPWRYRNWSMGELSKYGEKWARRNGRSPYNVMTTEEIMTMPVSELAHRDSLLAMWVTDPKLLDGLKVMEAWGFEYKTILFTWIKTNPKGLKILMKDLHNLYILNVGNKAPEDTVRIAIDMLRGWHFGLGFHTRANPELCLLGSKGKGLTRASKYIPQLLLHEDELVYKTGEDSEVIVAPVGEHSAKPAIARSRLEQLYGDCNRIEIFSRDKIEGWDVWGNEVESSKEAIATLGEPKNDFG